MHPPAGARWRARSPTCPFGLASACAPVRARSHLLFARAALALGGAHAPLPAPSGSPLRALLDVRSVARTLPYLPLRARLCVCSCTCALAPPFRTAGARWRARSSTCPFGLASACAPVRACSCPYLPRSPLRAHSCTCALAPLRAACSCWHSLLPDINYREKEQNASGRRI